MEDYKLEEAEVSGLIEINVQDAIDLLLDKKNNINGRGLFIVDKVRSVQELTIAKSDFVPSYLAKDQFFLRLLVAAKRYIDGDAPDEIFC